MGSLTIGSLRLSNPLLLAPLSGISNLPFRLLAKEQGCALVCTEMISAEGLLRNRKAAERLLMSCPEERPLAVQIFGSRAASMAQAAKMIEDRLLSGRQRRCAGVRMVVSLGMVVPEWPRKAS